MSGNEKLQSFNETVLPGDGTRGKKQDSKSHLNYVLDIFRNSKGARRFRAFFENENQDRTRADLATFFGPRADVYLLMYEKMCSRGGRWGFSFSWPVFFGGFVWLFYRKMYIWGAFLILLPIVLAVLYPSIASYSFASFAAAAKPLYLNVALSRIGKADQLGLTGAERNEYLRRAGGVSLTAGVISGFLFAAFLALVIYGTYLQLHPTG